MSQLAERQFGRVSWRQLQRIGVGRATICRWIADGYLHRVLPGVYAVGHVAPSTEADLVAAVLYAGPGAMLSHATAAWWHGLLEHRPVTLDISTPRRCRSLEQVRVHERRPLTRTWLKQLPVTNVTDTLLDFAAVANFDDVRRVLAEADYRRLLDRQALGAALGPGRKGSRTLRLALRRHMPQLALTRSGLEQRFLLRCEAADIPLPEVNVIVAGIRVDALWREQRIVVELDGAGNHGTPAQIRRDRRNELKLRAAGFDTVRYTWDQVEHQWDRVEEDLLAELANRSPERGAHRRRGRIS